MPNFFRTPFDKALTVVPLDQIHKSERTIGSVILPSSGWAALLRGLRGNCPRCGEALDWRRGNAMQRTAALVACLQPDRRVDVEVNGTR